MRKFIPIILLLIFASQNFAQEYFPLQIGNKWNMPGTGGYCTGDTSFMTCPQVELKRTIYLQILKDTLMLNGKSYAVLNYDFGFGKFVRVDSSFIYFYDNSVSADVPVFNLKAELHNEDSVNFSNSVTKFAIYLGEIKEEELFGSPVRILKYWVDGDKKSYYENTKFSIAFADKFGIVSYANDYWKDHTWYYYNYNSTGYKLNDIIYGNIPPPFIIPLAVGNKWTLHGAGQECRFNDKGEYVCFPTGDVWDTLNIIVVKDTTMPNNRTYYDLEIKTRKLPEFEDNANLRKHIFIRYDENYLYIYDNSSEKEVILVNLIGSEYDESTVYFGPNMDDDYLIRISDIEEMQYFGKDTRIFSFGAIEIDTLDYDIDSDIYNISISEKFGFYMASQLYWGKSEDPLDTLPYIRYNLGYHLDECVIDGVVYSNQISVEPGEEPNASKSFSLSQNYPNPFNPSTTIEFAVPKQTRIKLTVFDVLGREISVLANDIYSAGNYKAIFNGSNLPSGVYLYKLETDSYSQTRKFILLK